MSPFVFWMVVEVLVVRMASAAAAGAGAVGRTTSAVVAGAVESATPVGAVEPATPVEAAVRVWSTVLAAGAVSGGY